MLSASALDQGNLFKKLSEDDLLDFLRQMRRDMIDFAGTPEGKAKMDAWKSSEKGERK